MINQSRCRSLSIEARDHHLIRATLAELHRSCAVESKVPYFAFICVRTDSNSNAVPAILQLDLIITFDISHLTDCLHITILDKVQLAPGTEAEECARGLCRELGANM